MPRLLPFSLNFFGKSCSFWSWLLFVFLFFDEITFMPSSFLIYFTFSSSVSRTDTMGNWWETPCVFHEIGDNIGWESDGKKYPYFGESMVTNFPGSLNPMDFAAFSNAMGNWWGNPCISHMMRYTTGWESNGKKHPYYGKSMGTNFPGFAHLMVFAEFSHTIENWLENPYISPCNEEYHKMGFGWEKSTHTMRKVWVPISQVLPIRWVLLYFFVL